MAQFFALCSVAPSPCYRALCALLQCAQHLRDAAQGSLAPPSLRCLAGRSLSVLPVTCLGKLQSPNPQVQLAANLQYCYILPAVGATQYGRGRRECEVLSNSCFHP